MVTEIEPRTKIIFVAIGLLINLLSPTVYTPLAIAFVSLVTLLALKIPPKILLLRLAMPLVMAVVVLITQIFFYGTTPLFILSFGGLQLTGYQEGLAHGFLIMWRVLAGVSLILLLTMSTPAHRLFLAATWFRVPKIFIKLALLIYRYIFVLMEEVEVMKNAQRVRLGYSNWSRSMKSLGVLGGSLLLRAYDRAERVFAAMQVRGYTGDATLSYQQEFGKRDYLTASCLGLALVIFYLVGQIQG
ncbi:MAG: cobalt ECF transporter T component CbiQ [Chloroflexi bacterium]|nr:cobalt ECF transporter T component CbiQ [Chloroflexota bacterium]